MTENAYARAALPSEAEEVLQTLCSAFDLNVDAARPIFYGDPFFDLSHKRVLVVSGLGIVSCLTVVPTILRIGGVPVKAAGVAGVATRPEFQGRGYAAALLSSTVPELWDELGYPLSLLYPVSAPFYRRYGWETASSILRWVAVPKSLPAYLESATVRPVMSTDWPDIEHLQSELTRHESGACVRDSRHWALIQMPLPGREVYVYQDGQGISGYVIWERKEMLEILEMLGRNSEARQGLIGFLALQSEPLVSWSTSPALMAEFGLTTTKQPEPSGMLRIADLEAALSAVHAPFLAAPLEEKRTTVTIFAENVISPRNARPLRLTPEGIEVGRFSDIPWLRADIRTLATLFLGFSLPSEAHHQGLLTTDSPETLALADRLFPLRAPYIAPLDQS